MFKRSILPTLLFICFSINAFADVEIKRDYAGNILSIENIPAKDSPFKIMASREARSVREVADDFVREYASVFGIKSFEDELQVTREKVDKTGTTHITYSQFFDGYPVYSAELVVHVGEDLTVKSLSGRILDVSGLKLNRKITFDEAYTIAERYWYDNLTSEYVPTLVEKSENLYIYDADFSAGHTKSDTKLVYMFQLKSEEARGGYNFVIDAGSGDIIQAFNPSSHLTRQIHDCSLETGSYGLCELGYVDENGQKYGRSEGMAPVGRNPNVIDKYTTDDAYDFVGHNINMYKEYFGINGANGQGGTKQNSDLVQVYLYRKAKLCGNFADNTHNCPSSGGVLCFFDQAIEICEGFLTPDVFGHEFAHSVSYYAFGFTPNASNNGCTYAITESFSDFMGEVFQSYVTHSEPDWINGTDITSPDGYSRDIVHPSKTGHPDNFCGRYATAFCNSAWDHYSSVVITRIFYYLSEGGLFQPELEDVGNPKFMYNGCNIKAIGKKKARDIFFHFISNYVTSSETFAMVPVHIVQACRDLYPTGPTCEWVQLAVNSSRMNQPGRDCVNQSDTTTACVDPVCDFCPENPNKQVEGYCGCDSPDPSEEDAAKLGKECTVGSAGCEATGVYVCDGKGGITCDADISSCNSCLKETRFRKVADITTVPTLDVASSDLNNDGKDDLIIAYANGEISFLNKSVTVPSLKYVFAKDINGDGKDDIVAASQDRDFATISVFMNKGNGNFDDVKTNRIATAISDIFFYDVDDDGKLDISILDLSDSKLTLFSGDGQGGFNLTKSANTRISSIPTVSYWMKNSIELIYGERSKIVIVKNEWKGDMNPQILWYLNIEEYIEFNYENLTAFKLEVLEESGYSDMVFGFDDATGAIVLQNDFDRFQEPQFINLKAPVRGIALIDYNNDNVLDIAFASEGGVELFINDMENPNCPFFCGTSFTRGKALQNGVNVSIADLNNDNIDDLISLGSNLQILYGKSDGSFVKGESSNISSGKTVTSSDLNGDGNIDIAVSDGKKVAVLLNDNGLQSPVYYNFGGNSTLNPNKGSYGIKTGDIDGDGFVDIITVNPYENSVVVLNGKGDGTFFDKKVTEVGRAPESIAVGDIDGNGIDEIVVGNRFDNSFSIVRWERSSGFTKTDYSVGDIVESLDIDDLDGDGKLDVVVAGAKSFNIFYGGNLTTPTILRAPNGQNLVKIIDFDKDGIKDIVSLNTRGIFTKVIGKGNRKFKSAEHYQVGSEVSAITYKDLNNDGLIDLIAADDGNVYSYYGSDSCEELETSNAIAFVPNGTIAALKAGLMELPAECIIKEKEVHAYETPTPTVTPTATPPIVSPTPLPVCYDTDGGSKPNVKGTVKFKKKKYNDKCLDKKRLQEWSCTKKLKAKKKIVKCKFGCKKGRCLAKKRKKSSM